MNEHVFISYSRIDGTALAERLAAALGDDTPPWRVWVDRTDIPPGTNFTFELDEAIRNCRCLIYLMTPDSVSPASFCRNEIARAGRYKKPIVPVLAGANVVPPLDLEVAQSIDVTSDFNSGLAALRAHLLWTDTPAGQLSNLRYRRVVLERELGKAGPAGRPRVEEELARVDRRMLELQEWLANPEKTNQDATTRIEGAVEMVRHESALAPSRLSSKFVNSAAFVPPLHFQDRHAETKLAVDFLRNPDKRLLTIVGRGGVGKTGIVCRLLKGIETGTLPDDLGELPVSGVVYLSEQRARRVSFPHLFEDLTKLVDPGSAEKAESIYRSPHTATAAKMNALLPLLPKGLIVVLLDNFEDLVVEGRLTKDRELFDALIAWLHAPANGVKVIITTRVSAADLSLAVPSACSEISLDEGLPSPHAEDLLKQLDSDGAVGFRSAPPDMLTEVARRVRGYPRALEALYAVLRSDRNTSLDELLGKAAAALPERVVEVMVGEAFSRLDRHEKVVLQALAIFNRPVPAVAVDYLLQPFVPAIESAAVLRWLVNLQIIRKDRDRYYLHPVDAEFALARIPEGASSPGDVAAATSMTWKALLGRAAEYFREIRRPTTEWNSIQDLEPQLAEFDLLCRAEHYDEAGEILLAIGFNYLRSWGHVRMLIELHERLRGRLADTRIEAQCLGVLGTAYWDKGDLSQAAADLRASIERTERVAGPNFGAAWWCDLGCCLRDMGRIEEAEAAHERALDVDHHVGDWSGVGSDLNNIAECYGDQGLAGLAVKCVNVAIEAIPFVDGHDRSALRLRAYRLATLAKFHLDDHRWAEAGESADEALRIGRQISNSEVNARASYYLALSWAGQGDPNRAREFAKTSLQFEYPRFKFRALLLHGLTLLGLGETADAEESFSLCAKECEDLLSRSEEHHLARHHLALARCGLFVCGRAAELKPAKDALASCATLQLYPGIRARCLHLLRLIATNDSTRQLGRLALLIEGAAGSVPPPIRDRSVLDHEAVRKLRAALIPTRLSQLHAGGFFGQCAETAADGETLLDVMPAQQRREFQRVSAWVSARCGFLDGARILDGILDADYVPSLLRASDYMAVYRFQGMAPAAPLRTWFEEGRHIIETGGADDSGAEVLMDEYQGCALLAAGDYAAAEQLLQHALSMEMAGKKDVRILSRLRAALGELYRLLGAFDRAEQLLETAAAFQEEHGFHGDLCEYTLPHLAKLHAGTPSALEFLRQGRAGAERLHHPKALVRILLIEARIEASEERRQSILTDTVTLAASMPALVVCPLMGRIHGHWSQWCGGQSGNATDYWGL